MLGPDPVTFEEPIAEAPAPERKKILRTNSGGELTDVAYFGGKTIGTFGAVVLVANNVVGPGMLELPLLFQQAGWLPTTISCFVVAMLSATAACFFCDAFALLPGNEKFQQRAEFNAPFKHHFGETVDRIVHVAYFLTIQCQNIASIVQTAQVMGLAARARSPAPNPAREPCPTPWRR